MVIDPRAAESNEAKGQQNRDATSIMQGRWHLQNAGVRRRPEGSPTETLLRLLLPLSDVVY